MSDTTHVHEAHPAVLYLARGKKLVHSFGLVTKYRLRNGWLAERRTPQSKWRDKARWFIYVRDEYVGGSTGRLTQALATILTHRRDNPSVAEAVARYETMPAQGAAGAESSPLPGNQASPPS